MSGADDELVPKLPKTNSSNSEEICNEEEIPPPPLPQPQLQKKKLSWPNFRRFDSLDLESHKLRHLSGQEFKVMAFLLLS